MWRLRSDEEDEALKLRYGGAGGGSVSSANSSLTSLDSDGSYDDDTVCNLHPAEVAKYAPIADQVDAQHIQFHTLTSALSPQHFDSNTFKLNTLTSTL